MGIRADEGPLQGLTVQSIAVGYGSGSDVISNLSLDVHFAEVVAVLGRNGAGKTTLLRSISGLLRPRAGLIAFRGASIVGRPPHEIAQMGIAHVPEGRRIIQNMTVADNLRVGAYAVRAPVARQRIDNTMDLMPSLRAWLKRRGGTLSGGEQQLVAIARALMSDPALILLDEPLTGLSPAARHSTLEVLKQISALGKGILIVEQNVVETLAIADRGVVLSGGSIGMQGSGSELLSDPAIHASYLGLGPVPSSSLQQNATIEGRTR